MLSRVKFLRQTPAKLLETETPDLCDKEIYHISYKDLVRQLQRPDLFLVKFGQTELDVKDQASYEAMHHLRLIIAVYKPRKLTPVLVEEVVPGQAHLEPVGELDVLHGNYEEFKHQLQFPSCRFFIYQGSLIIQNEASYQCVDYDKQVCVLLQPYVPKEGPWGG